MSDHHLPTIPLCYSYLKIPVKELCYNFCLHCVTEEKKKTEFEFYLNDIKPFSKTVQSKTKEPQAKKQMRPHSLQSASEGKPNPYIEL